MKLEFEILHLLYLYCRNMIKDLTREQKAEYQKCAVRFLRYKSLPDYYRKKISDTTFFTKEDLLYIKSLW